MQFWFKKFSFIIGIGMCVLYPAWGATTPVTSKPSTNAPAPPQSKETAIQAMQQASDPSALISAFANTIALDRNDPRIYQAYVARMVDLGLPEMAYHQADLLTTLKPDSGLAQAVIAYVNARRGQMTEAIAAINVAAPLSPTNKFVQSTAGEILAWYDLKADKSQISDNAKYGIENVRKFVSTAPVFTQAYTNAKQAYAAQAADLQQLQQDLQQTNMVSTNYYDTNYYSNTNYYPTATNTYGATPDYNAVPNMDYSSYYDYGGGYAAPAGYNYYPNYYPNYYYDYGPGWVAPSSSWWWYPNGWFWGFSFVPFTTTFVFDNDHHHHHNNFHHGNFDHGKFHDGNFHGNSFHNGQFHNGRFFANNQRNFSGHGNFNRSGFHSGTRNQASFFGAPARPNANVAATRQGSRSAFATAGNQGFNRNFHWNGGFNRNAGTWSGNTVTRQQSLPNMNLSGNQGAAPTFSGRSSQTVRSGISGNRGFANSGIPNSFVTRRQSTFSQTMPNGRQFNSSSTSIPRRSGGNPNAGSAFVAPGASGTRSAQPDTRQFTRPSGSFTPQRQQSFQQNLNNAPGSTAMRSVQPGTRQFARPSGNFTVQRQQTFQQNFNNGSSRSVVSSQMRSSPQSFNRSFASPNGGFRGGANMGAGSSFRGGGAGFQSSPGMSRGGGFQGGGMRSGGGFQGGGGSFHGGGNMGGGGFHGGGGGAHGGGMQGGGGHGR